MEIEQLWLAFKNILFDAISVSVPVYETLRTAKQCVYPKYLHYALNKKKALWRKRSSPIGKAVYKAYTFKCDKLVRHFHAAVEQRIICSNSVSAFFNYVGKKLNSNHKVAPLSTRDAKQLLSDADKADALNVYFSSVFTPWCILC